MTKPQIVLVPGAWHTPLHWSSLISSLTTHGYTIHTRQFPSVGNPSPPTSLSADIAALRTLVSSAIGPTGNDVVVICHSWGGMVTGSGLSGLSKTERSAAGLPGGVIRTGYIAAFIVPIGISLRDACGGVDPPWHDMQLPHVYATSREAFYSDLPASEQDMWAGKLQSQAYASFTAKATGESWRVVPTAYLLCEEDRALPVEAQEGFVEEVRRMGGEMDLRRIQAGHSPFLSMCEETVGWVRGVAGEEV
jgi:pimeloyl-ACP methyl ester carboxylesterase